MQTTAAPSKKAAKLPFAMGTTLYPTPISGLGGPLTYAANAQSVLTPIPKTGFLARLRFNLSGLVTFGTAAGTTYVVPLWRIIANYTLANSLNYPFRSLNSDDIWFWQQISTAFGGTDPIVNSLTYVAPSPTSTTANQPWAFSFVDEIWNNDGVNFSRYLLSAMTTSNDLTITFNWANPAALQQNGAVITALSGGCQVSAEYLTVPDPSKYEWPKRNLVQQMVGDASFNTAALGVNVVNLTPIQGPEFTGLGVQVLTTAGVPDSLLAATTWIQQIAILVNGTIPLYTFNFADLISRYERGFRRAPEYGYVYLDFMNDLGLVNAMSHTHRKVLSTSKYSQISVQVTLGNGFAGGKINLFKRTQQKYANNQ